MSQTQSELSYLFGHVLADLRTRPDPTNALPLSAAIVERSSYYKTDFRINTPVPLDKSLMHSEAARLASFNNWPHNDYRLLISHIIFELVRLTPYSTARCMCTDGPNRKPWPERASITSRLRQTATGVCASLVTSVSYAGRGLMSLGRSMRSTSVAARLYAAHPLPMCRFQCIWPHSPPSTASTGWVYYSCILLLVSMLLSLPLPLLR